MHSGLPRQRRLCGELTGRMISVVASSVSSIEYAQLMADGPARDQGNSHCSIQLHVERLETIRNEETARYLCPSVKQEDQEHSHRPAKEDMCKPTKCIIKSGQPALTTYDDHALLYIHVARVEQRRTRRWRNRHDRQDWRTRELEWALGGEGQQADRIFDDRSTVAAAKCQTLPRGRRQVLDILEWVHQLSAGMNLMDIRRGKDKAQKNVIATVTPWSRIRARLRTVQISQGCVTRFKDVIVCGPSACFSHYRSRQRFLPVVFWRCHAALVRHETRP